MSRRTLFALLVLAAVVAGLVRWQRGREARGEFDVEVPLFENLRAERISGFRIDHLERAVQLHIVRDPQVGWRIVDPIDEPADEGVVSRLLEIVATARALVVPAEERDPAVLGLDPPRVELLIETEDGGTQRVEIGAIDIDGYRVAVRSRGRLLRTLRNLDTTLDREVQDWRSRRPVRVRAEAVNELHRRGRTRREPDGPEIDLELDAYREGASWRAVRPYEAALDPLAVGIVVVAMARLRIDRFVDDSPEDFSAYGLDQPEVTVELVDREGRRTALRLARSASEGFWFANLEGVLRVWSVRDELVARLTLPLEELFDALFLRVSTEAVERIRLVRDGEEILLARGQDGWTVAPSRDGEPLGPTRRAEGARVRDILGRLADLELADFRPGSLESTGEAVWIEAGDEVFGARLGPSEPGADGTPRRRVQRVGEEVTATADPWLGELARAPLESFLSSRMIDVEEIDLVGLVLRQGDRVREYVRSERGRWSRAGSDEEARELWPLLDPLIFLRASRRLSPQQSTPLENPIEVEYRRREGPSLVVEIGTLPVAGAEGGPPVARAAVRVGAELGLLANQDLPERLADLLAE